MCFKTKFPTRYDTICLYFLLYGLNKGTDQMHVFFAADLHHYFCICKSLVSMQNWCSKVARGYFPRPNNRRFTFARIDMSYARINFYECAENLLSFARFNCAVFNYFYR